MAAKAERLKSLIGDESGEVVVPLNKVESEAAIEAKHERMYNLDINLGAGSMPIAVAKRVVRSWQAWVAKDKKYK